MSRGREQSRGGGAGRLLEAGEVAELLSVPVSWVREETRKAERQGGGLPFVALGRYRRYDREAVLGWLETLRGGTWRKHRPEGGS